MIWNTSVLWIILLKICLKNSYTGLLTSVLKNSINPRRWMISYMRTRSLIKVVDSADPTIIKMKTVETPQK
jgi:hypothetical protein